MTPAELSRTVLRAVRRAVDDGELDAAVCAAGEERIVVERPRAGGQGDYATNVALQLARPAGRPPRQVAEILSRRLGESPGIDGVVVTGPGFLNVRLSESASASGALVAEILSAGERYGFAEGATATATGQVVQLHAPDEVRALVVMDSVARLLRSQGFLVRTSCAGRPRPEWVDVLGVQVDASGSAPIDVNVRPVPAPADPVPLGRDAARWALLHPAAHDRPRIGDDEHKHEHLAQRESNPLFRVRYAHARTHALTRNAADLGFTADLARPADTAGHAEDVPGHEDLVAVLADHPRILRAAAEQHAPDRLARHLVGVADTFMASLCPAVLPQGEEKPSAAHRARLALAEAVGTVLAGGLTLLGIDAPEHL
ncbi:DALR anticodon-binding domain-containing protein [Streptomyces sp. NBC_01016]|uniref:ArgS-related anticodon-binding protein NrtL n=1 Tax=Streptomyces sp. NBC_01016 TaxID=2903720 RepID=UPI002256D7EF|nr:DALR anticodon-binding domain-containing protein [Streptomyces sp. NBC_01016]MCX4829339.1 DALR anticodon-binding domain-containing protein [Streptomyces sp. NBC_01016]